MRVGQAGNELVSYSGNSISMYTHTGTHIDALNHFGYHGRIFNGFSVDEHLGSRAWRKAGVDKHPPIIARGVMLDIAALISVESCRRVTGSARRTCAAASSIRARNCGPGTSSSSAPAGCSMARPDRLSAEPARIDRRAPSSWPRRAR